MRLDDRRERIAQPLGAHAGRRRVGGGAQRGHDRVGRPARLAWERGLRPGPAFEHVEQAAGVGLERLEHAPGRRRPDALEQLQPAKPGEAVGGVVGQAQEGQEVLDVRGLEVAQPAVLHVGDVATGELELEQGGVVRGAHQHRLLAQRRAPLARVEHALADLGGLGGLVEAEHQLGRAPAGALGLQDLAIGAVGLLRHGVGHVEQGLRRAVVALQRHHRRAGEVLGEGEDVLRRGRAEAVDGLQVVAHDGDVGALAAQAADEVDLEPVDVLVLVDEQVVDAGAQLRPDHRVLGQRAPVEQ